MEVERNVETHAAEPVEPWWMEFIRDEGLLDVDTSQVFADSINKTQEEQEQEQDQEDDDAEETSNQSSAFDEESLDEVSIQSSENSSEGEIDWHERLWTAARKHWNEDLMDHEDGHSNLTISGDEEANVATVLVEISQADEDRDQILDLRNKVASCLHAYVDIFYDAPLAVQQDTSENKKEANYTRTKSKIVNEELALSPFVPLPVLRCLCARILAILDEAHDEDVDKDEATMDVGAVASVTTNNDGKEQVPDRSSNKISLDSVIEILLSPDLGAFRRYAIRSDETPPHLDEQGLVESKYSKGRRISKKKEEEDKIRRQEINDFLYGDISDALIKEKVGEDADMNEEEEVRLSHVLANGFSMDVQGFKEQDWKDVFVEKVLLQDLLHGLSGDNSHGKEDGNIPTESQPLEYMYAITVLAQFLSLASNGDSTSSSFTKLLGLFCDQVFLRKRLIVMGLYNGITLHVQELDKLLGGLIDDVERTDLLFDSFQRAVMPCLMKILHETLDSVGLRDDSENRLSRHTHDWHDFSHAVSTCTEVGRALSFFGTTMGMKANEQLNSIGALDDLWSASFILPIQTGSYDEIRTKKEVSAYKAAIEAYRGALNLLNMKQSSVRISEKSNHEKDGFTSHPYQPHLLSRIDESRDSIELYLADTLSSLGYCYGTKMKIFDAASEAHSEALGIYVRHINREHPTVVLSLLNLGASFVEQQKWNEAARCFKECIVLLRNRLEQHIEDRKSTAESGKPLNDSELANQREELSYALQSMGGVQKKLGNIDAAIQHYEESLECIDSVDVSTSEGEVAGSETASKLRQFVRTVMSKLSDAYLEKSSKCHQATLTHALCSLYETETVSGAQSVSSALAICQLVRKATAVTKTCINKRENENPGLDKPAVDTDQKQDIEKPDYSNALQQLFWNKRLVDMTDLRDDLVRLGLFHFRLRDYNDAIISWEKAMDVKHSLASGERTKGRSIHEIKPACIMHTEVVERLYDGNGHILTLLGTAHLRLLDFSSALTYMESALKSVEHNGRIMQDEETDVRANIFGELDKSEGINWGDAIAKSQAVKIADIKNKIAFAYSKLGQHVLATEILCEAWQDLNGTFEKFKRMPSSSLSIGMESVSLAELSGSSDHDQVTLSNEEEGNGSIMRDLEISAKSVLASILRSLGIAYSEQNQPGKACKLWQGSIHLQDSVNEQVACLSNSTESLWVGPPRLYMWTQFFSIDACITLLADTHRLYARDHATQEVADEAYKSYELVVHLLEMTRNSPPAGIDCDNEANTESISEATLDDALLESYQYILQHLQKPTNTKNDDSSDQSLIQGGALFQVEKQVDGDAPGFTVEDILFRIGNIHAKKGNHGNAIKYYLDAKDRLIGKLGTDDHIIVGNILFNLGNAYRLLWISASEGRDEKWERAVTCLKDSLRISTSALGSDHETTADVSDSLGILYMGRGCDLNRLGIYFQRSQTEDEAIQLFTETAKVRRASLPESSLKLSETLYNLGLLTLRRFHGSEEGRESDLHQSVASFSSAFRTRKAITGDDVGVSTILHSLGVAFWNRAVFARKPKSTDRDEAVNRMEEALAILNMYLAKIDEEKAPVSVPGATADDRIQIVLSCANICHDLGRLCSELGRQERASHLFNNAIECFNEIEKLDYNELSSMKVSEKENTKQLVASTWESLGSVHENLSHSAEAISCYKKSLLIRNCWISSHDEIDREKFGCLNRGETIDTSKSTEQCLNYARTSLSLGRVSLAAGVQDEAMLSLSRSLRIFSDLVGRRSVETAGTLQCLGKVHSAQNNHDMALRCFREALATWQTFNKEKSALVESALLRMNIGLTLSHFPGNEVEAVVNHFSATEILEEVALSSTGESKTPHHSSLSMSAYLQMNEISASDALLTCYTEILRLAEIGPKDYLCEHYDIVRVMHQMANLLASRGRLEEALDLYTKVLETHRSTIYCDELAVANLQFNLGNVYKQLGDLDHAVKCHEDCHRLSQLVVGSRSVELWENMLCLGDLEVQLGSNERALEWYTGALDIHQINNISDEVAVSRILHGKGIVHDKLGHHRMAIKCLKEALAIGRGVFGVDHPDVGNMSNSLGNAYRNISELAQAASHYRSALEVRIKTGDDLGVANTKNNIGAVFSGLNQTDRAKAFYAQALKIKGSKLGLEHKETARTIYNLGQAFRDEGKNDIALRFFKEGLKIFTSLPTNNLYEKASCKQSIALILDEKGETDEAIQLYEEALELVNTQSQNNNEASASILHRLGILYGRRSDYERASQVFRSALQWLEENLGVAALETAATQHCLGGILWRMGRVDESFDLLSCAVKTRSTIPGCEPEGLLDSLQQLSKIMLHRKHYENTCQCLRRCLGVQRNISSAAEKGPDDGIANTSILLASVLQTMHNHDESLDLLHEALGIKIALYGGDSPEVATVNAQIGAALSETGNLEKAIDRYQEALRVRIAAFGPTHLDVAIVLEKIGMAEQKLGCHESGFEHLNHALQIKQGVLEEHHKDIISLLHAVARSKWKLKDRDGAIGLYSELVSRLKAINQNFTRLLVEKGDIYFENAEPDRALDCYKDASEVVDPSSLEAGRISSRLGRVYAHMESDSNALRCFLDGMCILEAQFDFLALKAKPCSFPKRDAEEKHGDLAACYEGILALKRQDKAMNMEKNEPEILAKLGYVRIVQGEYDKAAETLKKAIRLRLTDSCDGQEDAHLFPVSSLLNNLGNCLYDLAYFEDAETCLEEAVKISESTKGAAGPTLIQNYHSLALVHHASSNYVSAVEYYEKVLKLQQQENMGSIFLTLSSLQSMGEIFLSLGMYNASIERCKEALKTVREERSDDTNLIASLLHCLGKNHKWKKEYEQALSCFKECLRLTEMKTDCVPLVGRTRTEMGSVFSSRGEHKKATIEFQMAARLYERHFVYVQVVGDTIEHNESTRAGKEDNLARALINCVQKEKHRSRKLQIAETILDFGTVLEKVNRQDESSTCYEMALSVMRGVFNEDHLLIGEACHRLGALNLGLRRVSVAIEYFDEALRIKRSVLGNLHSDIEDLLCLLGQAHNELQDHSEALDFFEEFLKARQERITKTSSADREIDTLLRMGKIYFEGNRFDLACACFNDCVKLGKEFKVPKNDAVMGDVLFHQGCVFLETMQYDLAWSKFEQTRAVQEKCGEAISGVTKAQTLYKMGRILQCKHRHAETARMYETCLNTIDALGNPLSSPFSTRVLLKLSEAYTKLNETDNAQASLSRAEIVLIEHLDKSTEEQAECWMLLGSIHLLRRKIQKALQCYKKSLAIMEKDAHTNLATLSDVLHRLGSCHAQLEEHVDAEACLIRALQIREEVYGDTHVDTLETRRLLSFVLKNNFEAKAALEHIEKYIDVTVPMLKTNESLKTQHFPDVLECIDSYIELLGIVDDTQVEKLGDAYYKKGLLQAMEGLYRPAILSFSEALELVRNHLGHEHLSVADILFNVGVCKNQVGDADKAIQSLEVALAISTEHMGEDHNLISEIMQQLAVSYRITSNSAKAIEWGNRALERMKIEISLEKAAVLYLLAEMYYTTPDLKNAAQCFREYLRIKRKQVKDDDLQVASALFFLGTIYKTLDRDYSRSLHCFEDCLYIRKTILGDEGGLVADTYMNLGGVHRSLDDFPKALYCFDKAALFFAEEHDSEIRVSRALIGKADALSGQGEFLPALNCYSNALQIISQYSKGEYETEETAHALLCKGFALEKVGQDKEACFSYKAALSMFQETLGPEDPNTATTFLYIANFHLKIHNYEDALICSKSALSIWETTPEKDQVGDCHACMGEVYFALGDYDASKKSLDLALEYHLPTRGQDSLTVGHSLYILGCIHESQKIFDEASAYFSAALVARQKHFDRNSEQIGDVLFHLGAIRKKLEDFDGAVQCLRECLRIRTLAHGPEDIVVADVLYHLGDALFSQEDRNPQDVEESVHCFAEAIKVYTSLLGEDHVVTANCFAKLGSIFQEEDKLVKSDQCFKRSVAIFDANISPDVDFLSEDETRDVDIGEEFQNLAEALFEWSTVLDRLGRDEEALACYIRTKHTYRTLLGGKQDNNLIATIFYSMAKVHGRNQRYDEAMSCFEEALRIRVQIFGSCHEDVAEVLLGMGMVYDKKREFVEAMKVCDECLKIRYVTHGENSLEVAAALTHMGTVCCHHSNLSQAFEYWENALAIYRNRKMSDENPLVEAIMAQIALAREMRRL